MKFVVGVDEAGRGPLAGPMAVGVVRASEDFDFRDAFKGLNDSKQLSEKARERLFEELEKYSREEIVQYRVTLIPAADIDRDGITKSVFRGVEKGIRELLADASHGKVFLDGSLKAPAEYEQETIIKGDSLIPAIMLASVAAKVTRDRLMIGLAKEYPSYGFEVHKGYGTKAHYAAIREFGPSAEHRQLFLRKFFAEKTL